MYKEHHRICTQIPHQQRYRPSHPPQRQILQCPRNDICNGISIRTLRLSPWYAMSNPDTMNEMEESGKIQAHRLLIEVAKEFQREHVHVRAGIHLLI